MVRHTGVDHNVDVRTSVLFMSQFGKEECNVGKYLQ